ncbi:MAG: DUF3179 domain-containing protein [Micavibrio sp.]|nr:MAG: DUF3179 domain-containing protein [Micavibrio sp.]
MSPALSGNVPRGWQQEFPKTDFSRSTIDFSEVLSGGPPRDGIPSIDNPQFRKASDITGLGENEPVIALSVNGEHKAYPLRILMWHEIANDEIGGVPVSVTYCPLCNAAVVFDRRVNGKILDFGVSGKLRHSDMIMYDRQTETWWQQFSGTGVIGKLAGTTLTALPSRTIPFRVFRAEHPESPVLAPNNARMRDYGRNPYVNYDNERNTPFLFRGDYDGPVPALAYVVAVGDKAFSLNFLREAGKLERDGLVITWQQGMNSAMDAPRINRGRDIGFVTVQRKNADGTLSDEVHDVTFAFAFKAFHPDGVIYTD